MDHVNLKIFKSEEQYRGFLSYLNRKFEYIERYKSYLLWRKDTAMREAIKRNKNK